MYAPNIKDNPELKYAKEQIDREERKLNEYKKKLNFETQEQLKREEQFLRRQMTERQKLEAQLHRLFDTFKDSQQHSIQAHEDKIRESHSDLQRLMAELESARQSLGRNAKEQSKLEIKKSSTRQNGDPTTSPEMIRIGDRIEQEQRRLIDYERKLHQQTRDNQRNEEVFTRKQKREFEKLEQQQERELNSFKDSWERTRKFLDDKIKMTESMLHRLQADYKSKEREFEIENRQRLKAESEKRAQHGNNEGNKNFAKGADSALSGENQTTRRRSGGRW